MKRPHLVQFYCIIIYLYNLLAQALEHPAEARGARCYLCDCHFTFDRFLCALLYFATLHAALCHSSIATVVRCNHSAQLEYQDANH